MINRTLMELYDEYALGNTEALEEFANKTFGDVNVRNLFIGCTLIMFSKASGYKPRYDATRENLLSIVMAAKEKVDDTNLLAFYLERVNTTKGINKYLNTIVTSDDIDIYADTIIDYLEEFKPRFITDLKKIMEAK